MRTPLLYSPFLSERLSAHVYLKPECLQRTGSFKFRGAYNALSALDPALRARGVVAVSSGNHAQGVAEAARLYGVPATIVMPSDAPAPKRMRTERSGARVVAYDRATENRDVVVARVVEEVGGNFVHPFNDPFVIAGQGTVGLEIAEDCAARGIAPDIVVIPCSGGGLTAGITLAVTEKFPSREGLYGRAGRVRRLRAVAEEREARAECPDVRLDLRRAARARPGADRIGRSTRSGLPAALSPAIRRRSSPSASPTTSCGWWSSPAARSGLAALLAGRLDIAGKTVVIVLSGGNIGDEMLTDGIRAYRRRPEPRAD